MITAKQLMLWPIDNMAYNLTWYALQMAPLVLCLRGFLAGELRATFMLTLVSQLYFMHGVVAMVDTHTQVYGAMEIFVSLTLCGASATLVRKIREANPPAPSE